MSFGKYRFCKYAGDQGEYGTLINPYAEPREGQNHVDYMLTINASLLLHEEPSAATISSDVNYYISPLNSGIVHSIILC